MKTSEVNLNDRIGRLVIIGPIVKVKNKAYVPVRCDCGRLKRVRVAHLGNPTRSCGCLNSELAAKRTLRHGKTGSNTYDSWAGMIGRTTNPKHKSYYLYKDRAPPETWKIFENFYACMGDCPKGYTLERVNNDLPYSPENCVWIAKNKQGQNTSRVRWVKLDNEIVTLSELFRRAGEAQGVAPGTLQARYCRKKLSLAKATGTNAEFYSGENNSEG